MKRILSSTLAFICVFLVFLSVPAVKADANGIKTARELLYNGILNHADEIDVTSCGINTDECKEMLMSFFDTYPYAFVANRFNTNFSYNSTTNLVTLIKPDYLFDADKAKSAIETVDKKVNAIVSQMSSSWSVTEKLLYIHDYIVLNFEYDLSYQSTDIYTFFTQKMGTCNAYCMAFMALCNKMGIPCVLVSSEEMNHAWVRVQIDGEWYHIDVTHDDAIPDKLGRVTHDQFLSSDKKITTSSFDPHHGFITGFCTSEKYDNGFWSESGSNIVNVGGKWYYADSENPQIKTGSFSTLTGTRVYEFGKKWKAKGGYWHGSFSGLIAENGKLLYNTENEIIELDPSTGETRSVFTLASGQIYGLYRDEANKLCYVKADDPNGSNQTKGTFTVPAAPTEFKIRFISEGSVYASFTVKKGEAIPSPEGTPSKKASSKAQYEFSHWKDYDASLKATSDRDFEAVFDTIPVTTASQSTSAPATTMAAGTTAPASSVPASTEAATTSPASTAPVSSSPAPGESQAEVSAAPESQIPPTDGNGSPKGSVAGHADDNPVSTEINGVEEEEKTDLEKAAPIIIAGAGGVSVVSGFVAVEKLVMPRIRFRRKF